MSGHDDAHGDDHGHDAKVHDSHGHDSHGDEHGSHDDHGHGGHDDHGDHGHAPKKETELDKKRKKAADSVAKEHEDLPRAMAEREPVKYTSKLEAAAKEGKISDTTRRHARAYAKTNLDHYGGAEAAQYRRAGADKDCEPPKRPNSSRDHNSSYSFKPTFWKSIDANGFYKPHGKYESHGASGGGHH